MDDFSLKTEPVWEQCVWRGYIVHFFWLKTRERATSGRPRECRTKYEYVFPITVHYGGKPLWERTPLYVRYAILRIPHAASNVSNEIYEFQYYRVPDIDLLIIF